MKRITEGRSKERETGMTLLEILTALALLSLIAVTFLPIQVFIVKAVEQNRIRLTASQLAKAEIERITGELTPQNYPDLAVGITDKQRKIGTVTYNLRTVVSWVDDPSDGRYPSDPIPFDYKRVEVIVTVPGLLEGKAYRTVDIKTARSREGAEDPYAGILIQVLHGWKQDGVNSPVAGVEVYATPAAGGGILSGVTDQYGQVILPVALPSGIDEADYHIRLVREGMIALPRQNDVITADRWHTASLIMYMETPCSVVLHVPHHRGARITLKNESLLSEDVSFTAVPGDDTVAIPGLWPVGPGEEGGFAGQYDLTVDLTAHEQEFAISGGYTKDKPRLKEIRTYGEGEDAVTYTHTTENLWRYAGGEWQAGRLCYSVLAPPQECGEDLSKTNDFYDGEYENCLLSPPLDLSGFVARDVQLQKVTLNWEETIEQGSAPGGFPVAQKSRDGVNWSTLLTIAGRHNSGDQNASLEDEDLVSGLRLRFPAHPAIGKLELKRVSIECCYEKKNLHFTAPGQRLDLYVTQE